MKRWLALTESPRLARWCLVLALGASACPHIHAASADEAYLQSIREAMVDAAINSGTHVKTTSWMDSGGALHEYNRFTSEIRLSELRMNAQQAVEERGSKHQDFLSERAVAPAVTLCSAPAAKNTVRLIMAPSLSVSPRIVASQRYLAQLAARQAMAVLMTESAGANQWRLVQTNFARTHYDADLSGRGEDLTQWRVDLQVVPAQSQDAIDRPHALSLSWSVQRVGSNKTLLKLESPLPLTREWGPLQAPRLEQEQVQAIATSAQSVIKALDQQLSCEPQPIEVRANDGRLNLSAGALSGVRVGDRLLLVDQTKLPEHALEAGALDSAVMAEVKSVSSYRSELKPVAGQRPAIDAAWVAWPFTY